MAGSVIRAFQSSLTPDEAATAIQASVRGRMQRKQVQQQKKINLDKERLRNYYGSCTGAQALASRALAQAHQLKGYGGAAARFGNSSTGHALPAWWRAIHQHCADGSTCVGNASAGCNDSNEVYESCRSCCGGQYFDYRAGK